MFSAFSTALSALSANSVAVDVIGNNLANLNTPGFKTSVVSFHDLVSQSLGQGSGANQVGLGTGRPDTLRVFTQGTIQASGSPMDAAIQGDGFFVVKDQTGQMLFTRAGNFRLDATGNLLTSTGQNVQGWMAVNGAINTSGGTGNISVPVAAVRPPAATTKMTMDLNLDAGAAKDATFSAPIEVVDSLGGKHVLTMTFTKTGANAWKYDVSIPGAEVSGGTAGKPFVISGASGNLTFDAQGQLKTPAPDSAPVSIKVSGLTNGAADLAIDWSLFSAGSTSRLTQFAQTSALAATSQDGSASAQITSVALSDGGKIVAHYSNGQQLVVAQLALAGIRNPESLLGMGNNNYLASAETAAPAIGAPETGSRGKIVGGSLEGSTVDIAREFTQLIVMQRSYQANARVITTTDEISQETINLKR